MTTPSKTKGREAPPKPAQPTPADQWITDDLIRLPGSGKIARLRRPPLHVLAARDLIPNPYLDPIRKLLTGREPDRTHEDRWRTFTENLEAFIGVAQLAFQEPRLVTDREPGPGEIGPQHLSDLDLNFIYFTYTEGSADDVAPFRAK